MISFPRINIALFLLPFTIGCHTDIAESTKTNEIEIEITEEHAIVDEDFETHGLFFFVLEPFCIPYEVGFSISHNSGEIKIWKTSTIGCLQKCCKPKYKYFFNN